MALLDRDAIQFDSFRAGMPRSAGKKLSVNNFVGGN